jgi:hypothetical protein
VNKTTLSWTEPLGGNFESFDVLRSTTASNFTTATCIDPDGVDTTAVDATTPAAGQTFFYLVRAGNDCGEGTLGFRSSGVERVGSSCP